MQLPAGFEGGNVSTCDCKGMQVSASDREPIHLLLFSLSTNLRVTLTWERVTYPLLLHSGEIEKYYMDIYCKGIRFCLCIVWDHLVATSIGCQRSVGVQCTYVCAQSTRNLQGLLCVTWASLLSHAHCMNTTCVGVWISSAFVTCGTLCSLYLSCNGREYLV